MEVFSYNETKHHQLALRHIFFPSVYGFLTEAVIAILALIVFNATQLNDRLFNKNFGTFDPFALWSQTLKQLADSAGQHHIIQQVFLLGLWAITGALIYVLAFRLIQIFFGVKQSVDSGVRYVRTDHANGLLRWLASLHNFFLKILIGGLGTAAIFIGATVFFGMASQELNKGLAETLPKNVALLLFSGIAAIISVRLIFLVLACFPAASETGTPPS